MNEQKARRLAHEIIDCFEELLDQKGISIPSEDREGSETEARIYGSEYYDLEDQITKLLKKTKTR